jgi:hypothetical protein
MVLELLMGDPTTRQIPLILFSSYREFLGDEEAQLRAYGYVIVDKPYPLATLLTQVRTLLGGAQARAGGET